MKSRARSRREIKRRDYAAQGPTGHKESQPKCVVLFLRASPFRVSPFTRSTPKQGTRQTARRATSPARRTKSLRTPRDVGAKRASKQPEGQRADRKPSTGITQPRDQQGKGEQTRMQLNVLFFSAPCHEGRPTHGANAQIKASVEGCVVRY